MTQTLLSQLELALRLITPQSAAAFNKCLSLIAFHSEKHLFESETGRLYQLGAQRNFIQRSHIAHGRFIANAVELQSPQALLETLLWAYRNYPAHGVSNDYFELMFTAWHNATLTVMKTEGEDVAALFKSLQRLHPTLCELSQHYTDEEPLPPEVESTVTLLTNRLLADDEKGTRDLLESHITQVSQIPLWWEEIMAPALRRIGTLWAINKISFSEEHAATAIAQRLMDRVHPSTPTPPTIPSTIAVIVTPGEQHELGAVMVRDLLELTGFSVLFVNATVSLDTTIVLLKEHPIRAILISTTLPENLTVVRNIIHTLRASSTHLEHVIVGGRAYSAHPELAQTVGADRVFQLASQARDYLLQSLSLEEYQGVG